jgi:flagellar protein FliO/FliZ
VILPLCVVLAISGPPPAASATPAPPTADVPAPSPAPITEDPTVLGHGPGTPSLSDADQPESLGMALVKMVLGLGVTLGAIYLSLSYLARRLQQLPAGRGTLVKVVERLPLEPRRTLYVVEAAGEYLLVGSGEGPMALITKLDAEKAKAVISQARAAVSDAPRPFWLRLLAKRTGEPK